LRYDACIIGAGADGLAAGAWLAARGLKVIVVERDTRAGGRCATREFHPGFRASPFVDELPEIPPAIFRALDLARRGVILSRAPHVAPTDAVRAQVLARVTADAETVQPRRLFARRPPAPTPWPGEAFASRSLAECDSPAPLDGRLCDPSLAGSALTLLAGTPGGLPAGGLGRLGEALRAAAEEAGAGISCGLEVTDIHRKRGRAISAGLADGREIAARAFISTLDLKRTFLALFAWNELPRAVVDRVGAFRAAPGIARLLVALAAPPETADREALRAPILVAPAGSAEVCSNWRNGTVAERPPATLRLVTAVDPFLAPDGCATLTVTLGAIPHTLFDGAWTHDKRNRLRDTALAIAEQAFPGIAARVIAAELIVPPDIESQLGIWEGDLLGGDLSATQMLGFRPFPECSGTRTPVEGLYLAGPSSTLGPLATCASGVAAAHAVLADMRAGRLK
jgi:phytoene dehydrogenase-like protein